MSVIRFTGNSESARARRFDELVRPYVLGLYRTAYRYTGRREDAEDLVQDLLLKLYPRLPELEQVEDLKPWLTRSLYNAFVDGVRKFKRTPELVDLEASELESADDPHADLVTLEQRGALNSAIAKLNAPHRAVVMLHLVEGYSLPELASMLGVQIGTLKSRLHRAKAQLQDSLALMEPKSSDQRVTQHEQ
ncbi:MAG: RNA polymerase sigma factor [Pseudomonadales bacterium]